MPPADRKRALLLEYFEVLRGGAPEGLRAIVAEDCRDHDPLPGQLPGRAGVLMKVALFRAAHPDARVVIEAIEPTERGARATWTTTATGLGGATGEATWRFSAVFEIDEEIRSSRLDQAELLAAP